MFPFVSRKIGSFCSIFNICHLHFRREEMRFCSNHSEELVQITLTFSRIGTRSYKFDVSRPFGLVSSSKLCQAVKRFDSFVPRVSKPFYIIYLWRKMKEIQFFICISLEISSSEDKCHEIMHSHSTHTNAGSVKSGISLNVNEINIQTLDTVNIINAIQFGCNANNL